MMVQKNKLTKFKCFPTNKCNPYKIRTFKKTKFKFKMMKIVHYRHKMMKYSKKSDYKESNDCNFIYLG